MNSMPFAGQPYLCPATASYPYPYQAVPPSPVVFYPMFALPATFPFAGQEDSFSATYPPNSAGLSEKVSAVTQPNFQFAQVPFPNSHTVYAPVFVNAPVTNICNVNLQQTQVSYSAAPPTVGSRKRKHSDDQNFLPCKNISRTIADVSSTIDECDDKATDLQHEVANLYESYSVPPEKNQNQNMLNKINQCSAKVAVLQKEIQSLKQRYEAIVASESEAPRFPAAVPQLPVSNPPAAFVPSVDISQQWDAHAGNFDEGIADELAEFLNGLTNETGFDLSIPD